MKFLVVGAGSIGKRHLNNLKQLNQETYCYSYRESSNEDELMNLLKDDFDAVVIANSTHLHIDVAIEAAINRKHLFIEKPLSNTLADTDKLFEIAENERLVIESGFMLRCHPNLIWIKQYLESGMLGDILYLRGFVGQWLPDWRPNTDYKNNYGAKRNLGGGVIFDLIHELDILYWLAGNVADVQAMTSYSKTLEIETESIAQVTLKMESGALAQIHLDYLRLCYGREFEIVGSKGILRWDYVDGRVSLQSSQGIAKIVNKVPDDFQRNDLFTEHMECFINRIKSGNCLPISPLNEAIDVLKIALASHYSAEQRINIQPESIKEYYKPTEINL